MEIGAHKVKEHIQNAGVRLKMMQNVLQCRGYEGNKEDQCLRLFLSGYVFIKIIDTYICECIKVLEKKIYI